MMLTDVCNLLSTAYDAVLVQNTQRVRLTSAHHSHVRAVIHNAYIIATKNEKIIEQKIFAYRYRRIGEKPKRNQLILVK